MTVGIFVCMRISDRANLTHILNEIEKQDIKHKSTVHIVLHYNNKTEEIIPLESRNAEVIHLKAPIGKLNIFRYVQKNFDNFDYYIFADCDIFFNDKYCFYNLIKTLETYPEYGFTSARSFPVIIKNNKLNIIDKINVFKINNDIKLIKIKVNGGLICFRNTFFKNINFNKTEKYINEDTWIENKYFDKFVPSFLSFYWHILPHKLADRISQQARTNLGYAILKKNKINIYTIINKVFDWLSWIYTFILYIKWLLKINYWDGISSTKPNKRHQELVYPKDYEIYIKKVKDGFSR